MSDFSHVTNDRLRQILETRSCGEDDICFALTETREAVTADADNEDVSAEVLAAREDAIEEAEFQWNEEGSADGAIEALGRCWGV